MHFLSAILPIVALVGSVSSHPGEHEEHGTLARREFLGFAERSIAGCQSHLAARGHEQKSIARRAALAENLRRKRGLPVKRDLESVLDTNHKSNTTGLTADSTADEIFTGTLNCVLQSEVTIGPYCKFLNLAIEIQLLIYIKGVSGELIRANMTEEQEGVALYADIQIIDVSTCEPVSDVYLDSWHGAYLAKYLHILVLNHEYSTANSTGVYSGVVASGNGNMNDASNIVSSRL